MSTASRQRDKARSINLDEDDAPASPLPPVAPRTAPGQLIGLQGRVHSQQQEIEQLKKALQERAPSRLPVAKLHEVEGRRRKLTTEEYAELKANLERYPLAQPITVARRLDGEFDIVAGNNRAAIYRELGREEIDAMVLDIDESMIEHAALFSNLLSPALSDFEKYWGFKTLQEQTGINKEELAKTAGISDTHVRRIMKFDLLPEAAKETLAQRPERLGSAAVEQLVKAAREGREALVIEAVGKLVESETFTQAQAVAHVAVKKEKSERKPALVIKRGQLPVCQITSRNGVVGVNFPEKGGEDADAWAQRIHDFIEAELKGR
ncbi:MULTISPECIES: ParB/RepB/Spo0J family partition protein [Caballeronia]|jgi:ParB family chromosome partitioning protein|uniref:ParB, partition protein n=1 Tax=Caballeronia telluris TaxID=326475 RepID=A0A158KGC0_9BURK|nr:MULTISPECIES: ParB N-terminal domain-containing protein [Caballeronia]MDR5754993.1 ParB N-terminal domain-containing protein [Caballeronia sp. LZ024]MDR5845552.1 ParB N-terminal domain-containing protein [Caballeronia sp. LZ031]SAL80104.1 ParB, partition protein [Caballeronia telluris]